ncbi:MAG TPA: COX15/CtaA family protein [Longimicrobiales bacterium]
MALRSPQVKRLGRIALFAAIYTYALILFGGIVRITGSGMGCGDHWPKCNGVWIPEFTLETLIEYTHRALAAGIGLVVLAVVVYALANRGRPGIGGKGGLLRPILLGAVLVVVQALLGAVTVKLEIPPGVVVVHFMTALLFASTLLVAAVRAGTLGGGTAAANASGANPRRAWRMAFVTLLFGFVLITLGAMTANVAGAPQACQGFPLCNNSLAPPPGSGGPAHIHFTHRMVAYLFTLHILMASLAARRRAVSVATKRAAAVALIAVIVQICVAAIMVLSHLPPHWQSLHLATGAAIWFALVVWAALARRDLQAEEAGSGDRAGLAELDPALAKG